MDHPVRLSVWTGQTETGWLSLNGILFLSDDKISELMIKKELSYSDFLKQSKMSESALYNRLKNWLLFTVGLKQELIYKFLNDYRYRNDNSLIKVLQNANSESLI